MDIETKKQNLEYQRNKLNKMKECTERLYAAIVDQRRVLSQVYIVLQDTKHKIEVDSGYYLKKIDNYSIRDHFSSFEATISYHTEEIKKNIELIDDANNISIDELNTYASYLDNLLSGCATQIKDISQAINVVNWLLERLK